jgi:glycerol-3-phosphate dehydrogenase
MHDVAVIGGGITGASAAQHLTAAGFSVILMERGDYAAATSSRTSRLQHCGLSYLTPGKALWKFLIEPTATYECLDLARRAMRSRSEFVRSTPARVKRIAFHLPIYRKGLIPLWKAKLGMSVLEGLDRGGVPLEMTVLAPADVRQDPALQQLRNLDDLMGVVRFVEYQFDWPERVCLDAIMNAADQGADVRNYVQVTSIERGPDGTWELRARDLRRRGAEQVVRARAIVNAAGVWVDELTQSAKRGGPVLNQGCKGTNVMVRLPPEFRGMGFEAVTRAGGPFYIIPWRDMHYFGPVDAAHDATDAGFRATEDEIASLLAEINYFLPKLGIRRADVVCSWAGVRPLTARPGAPMGTDLVELHDLAKCGLAGYYVHTGGLYMLHRQSGRTIAATVRERFEPSTPAIQPVYDVRVPPHEDSPTFSDNFPEIRLDHLRHACESEQVRNLDDLLFRRVPIGWSATMGHECAHDVAQAVRDIMDWSPAEAAAQASAYIDNNRLWFGLDENALGKTRG